jgi:predicted RND superfamily exporter protein
MEDSSYAIGRVLVFQVKKIHIAMIVLSVLMIPGAMTALEPIDMESYEMESPELSAQSIIEDEFSDSEIILGFMVGIRQPELVPSPEDWEPVPLTSSGAADYANLPQVSEMLPAGDAWSGIEAPTGGILNLSVLREIDEKIDFIQQHPLAPAMKPLVNDVTGQQSSGAISLPNHFRSFMNGTSILTQPGLSSLGVPLPAPTNWTDCFPLDCLEFDDDNITQQHIDMAASRMADASNNNFLRWLSLDRGFLPDEQALQIGPVEGSLEADGSWGDATMASGRWSASSTWLLIQLDRTSLREMGWEVVWKDAHQEKSVYFSDDGFHVGGYRFHDNHLILHPPQYNSTICQEMMENGAGCSTEWSYMDLEGQIRTHDRTTITLLLGQGVNVEVNRELQSSAGLIVLMMLCITVLLFVSLRRWSDVVIVMAALGFALLWMQGLIGYVSSFTSWLGLHIITRSQFSNLLPILVLALGIDDSLHALHRYKEERRNGKSTEDSALITIRRVGRAITLTSITTMVAFAANLFSDIAALRSFGVEAALGIFAAFLLTGIWTPLIRMSVDDWFASRQSRGQRKEKQHIERDWLEKVPVIAGQPKYASIILVLALLVSIPSAIGMSSLEGDFAVEDFLDEDSDFAVGVHELNQRFATEGEPANLLIMGDVLDPQVYASIDIFRQKMNDLPEGVPDKVTRQPDGTIDLLALDEMVLAAQGSLVLNSTPFEQAGWVVNESEHGVGCPNLGSSLFVDTGDRDCLSFFYGFLSLYGVPGTGPIPDIPPSIVRLYITPDVPLDPLRPWLDENGEPASYSLMQIRFGVTQPEDFPSLGAGIDEIWNDLEVFTNLSSGSYASIGPVQEEDKPLTWVMLTGRPITRYAASTAMQEEMQSSLVLGSFFVLISLSIGFRSFSQAIVTFLPILVVVVWLYGLMFVLGASLNIVTVTIATISLGVGIDYCIHVTERYRESKNNRLSHDECLHSIGGACGLALLGSATSDIVGFSVIALSPMGLFSSFGIFSAAMIALSLFASLVLTTSLLGLNDALKAKIGKNIEGIDTEPPLQTHF